MPRSEKRDDAEPLTTRFAFGDSIGRVLQQHFDMDARQAQLSTKFRLYYRLRPIIPLSIRQRMQRGRNQGLEVGEKWYLPSAFVDDLRHAIEAAGDSKSIHPWPDHYQMSSVLTHDIETKEGMDRVESVATLEERLGLRSAWYFIGFRYKIDWGLLKELKRRGHEIGVHGYNHDGRLFESRHTFRRRAAAINRRISDFGSVGFRAPMVHRNLRWIQDLDVHYDASCFDIDPFQAMAGGVGGVWPFVAGHLIELPYTLPQDHTLLVSLGETSPRIWIEKMEFLRSLSGMAMLITHPDYLDTRQRFEVYRKFLEYLVAQPDCWRALPRDVADWWRQRDQLQLVKTSDTQRIEGPSADRAKTISLAGLRKNLSVQEGSS